MKGNSEREAKGVAPDCLGVDILGEVKKGVEDPARVLDVELPIGVESCMPHERGVRRKWLQSVDNTDKQKAASNV